MNKVDFIKLRVTPEFKARVRREAAYRQIGVSKLIVEALEAEMTSPDPGVAAPSAISGDVLRHRLTSSRPGIRFVGPSALLDEQVAALHSAEITMDTPVAPEVPVATPEESVPDLVPTAADAAWKKDDYAPWRSK